MASNALPAYVIVPWKPAGADSPIITEVEVSAFDVSKGGKPLKKPTWLIRDAVSSLNFINWIQAVIAVQHAPHGRLPLSRLAGDFCLCYNSIENYFYVLEEGKEEEICTGICPVMCCENSCIGGKGCSNHYPNSDNCLDGGPLPAVLNVSDKCELFHNFQISKAEITLLVQTMSIELGCDSMTSLIESLGRSPYRSKRLGVQVYLWTRNSYTMFIRRIDGTVRFFLCGNPDCYKVATIEQFLNWTCGAKECNSLFEATAEGPMWEGVNTAIKSVVDRLMDQRNQSKQEAVLFLHRQLYQLGRTGILLRYQDGISTEKQGFATIRMTDNGLLRIRTALQPSRHTECCIRCIAQLEQHDTNADGQTCPKCNLNSPDPKKLYPTMIYGDMDAAAVLKDSPL